MSGLITILVAGIFVLSILLQIFKILREYERAVIYTLGRYTSTSGPGLIILIPFIQQMVRVDMRTIVHDVPPQDVISKDNVSVKVNAVIYYRVIDANNAINKVEDFMMATSQLAQTTLRSVLGKHDLDDMLKERDKLNHDVQEIIDQQTDAWGIKVSNVEIKHVDLDPSMIRTIGKQAEAERERRAKVISADGEFQAAAKLAEAAKTLATEQGAMQLRYLGALQEIAGGKTNTIVFPMPMEGLSEILPRLTGGGSSSDNS